MEIIRGITGDPGVGGVIGAAKIGEMRGESPPTCQDRGRGTSIAEVANPLIGEGERLLDSLREPK